MYSFHSTVILIYFLGEEAAPLVTYNDTEKLFVYFYFHMLMENPIAHIDHMFASKYARRSSFVSK